MYITAQLEMLVPGAAASAQRKANCDCVIGNVLLTGERGAASWLVLKQDKGKNRRVRV